MRSNSSLLIRSEGRKNILSSLLKTLRIERFKRSQMMYFKKHLFSKNLVSIIFIFKKKSNTKIKEQSEMHLVARTRS